MTGSKTRLLAEEKQASGLSTAKADQTSGWRPTAIATDIATLGIGTVVGTLFNVVLVFVVPKLTSVENYGYWRLFGLYAGYVGFLHFGFADGALLRWAGRPFAEFHHEIGPALKYLFWQHVLVLTPLSVIAALVFHGPLRFIAIALAIYALVFNLGTLLQYGLQSAKFFRPVAMSAVAAPALFLGLVLVWPHQRQIDYREIIVFYGAGWLVVLIFLFAWTKPLYSAIVGIPERELVRACLRNGWPIVIANTGIMLVMFADRLAASWAVTIQDFARYSLAASAMALPITAIQSLSNVFFPHLAGVTLEGRKHIYGITSRMLLIAWAILLPYYFALDLFLRYFLPRYMPSIVYARILLLGIPFLAAVQILQTNYAYLSGVQKQFMIWTGAVVVLSLAITSLTAFSTGSLRVVAGVQVAVLGTWWLFNEWALRDLTGQTITAWIKFLGIYGLSSGSYWIATTWQARGVGVSILAYYAGIGVILVVMCRGELRTWTGLALNKQGLHGV